MRCILSSLSLTICCLLTVTALAAESNGRGFVLWAPSAATQSCVTTDCHAVMGRDKHVHAPVAEGDCLVCHGVTDTTHPGQGSIVLIDDEPGLCLQCHENPASAMAYPHSALEEGCTGCHNPHQSTFLKMVVQPGGQLCLSCHAQVKAGKYLHGPIRGNNCGICHGVHGGQSVALLNRPGKEICIGCHASIKTIIDDALSQHEPVKDGLCWNCHAPHASEYQPLLLANYALGFYAAYEKEQYDLCFMCHNVDAFEYERTSEATGFRNRDQNLHYFHVNGSKGRTCKTCHAVHGADQKKLLTSEVQGFGRWAIPLDWVEKGEGGSCSVGCHRKKEYDRYQKVNNF